MKMDYEDDYEGTRGELTDEEEVRPKKSKTKSAKTKSSSHSKSSSSSRGSKSKSRKAESETEAEQEPDPDADEEDEEMAKLDEKIGFMGGGMMAYAIASGMVNRGIVKPNQILASGPHPENLEKWKEMGASYTTENEDVSIGNGGGFIRHKIILLKDSYFSPGDFDLKSTLTRQNSLESPP